MRCCAGWLWPKNREARPKPGCGSYNPASVQRALSMSRGEGMRAAWRSPRCRTASVRMAGRRRTVGLKAGPLPCLSRHSRGDGQPSGCLAQSRRPAEVLRRRCGRLVAERGGDSSNSSPGGVKALPWELRPPLGTALRALKGERGDGDTSNPSILSPSEK